MTWHDVPGVVRTRIASLLRDYVAVSLAGRVTPTCRLAVEHAAAQHAGEAATALCDGRRLATVGAAWANGVLANALDFDDGHRLVKGHPGANVISSALAAAEAAGATFEEFLTGVAVGYEVAIRAGLDLHRRSLDYHGSGAWGAVGAAAAAARLLRLDPVRSEHALGLAEYHAPMALTMRSVAEPAMTKDACGWGALVGISSALLARRGFTATASTLSQQAGTSAELGDHWRVLEVYVKEYPCCRWSHPAIAAALRVRRASGLQPSQIASVDVRTFAAAAALARRPPGTTEEAQYNVVWPVAVALGHGSFGVEHVLEPSFTDPRARDLLSCVQITVDSQHEAAFPARRLAEVRVVMTEGAVHRSGPVEAPGEPEDPRWSQIVEAKFERFAGEVSEPALRSTGSMAGRSRDELLALLAFGAGCGLA